MIVFVALIFITHQTTIYEFDVNQQSQNDWEVNQFTRFLYCNQIRYFGSDTSTLNEFSKIFENLEPHSHIQIDAQLLGFQNSISFPDPTHSSYHIDSIQQPPSKFRAKIKNCNFLTAYYYKYSEIHQHNRRTAWVKFRVNLFGGLTKFKLSIINCQYGCMGCIENYQVNCLQWRLHQYSLTQKFITNLDGWDGVFSIIQDFNCGNCQQINFKVISYSTILPPHQDVLIRFFKFDSNSIIINYRHGDKVVTSDCYMIEILIQNYPDSILNLDISTEFLSEYSIIRDFEIFYTLQDQKLQNWNEGCLESIANQCVICQEGWIQDEYLENCKPICGDMIIQGQEQCEDGNEIPYDGCFNCVYSCCEFCRDCQFGICKECQNGFIINASFSCDPLCGDGIIIPYSSEQCEIETFENNNSCQECRFLPIPNCKIVYFSICLECEKGYQNLDNFCSPNCGDSIILQEYEDCDDGNIEPYDGCYECKFQCVEGCNSCDKGQCLKCNLGYDQGIQRCLSICGDQVITKQEDCDDGNIIEFDGCFNCKYSCPQNCYNCQQGICLECNQQYFLLSSNRCELNQQCGDGIVQENEKCDDENYQAADGCQNCQVQYNWICKTMTIDSPSICTFVKAPNLVIAYLNMTQNKQYISIQFDQYVKIETVQPLSQTIDFELFNIDKMNWKSSLQIIVDVGSFLSIGKYILEVEVFQLLDFRPVLKIEIFQPVVNDGNVALVDYSKFITLQYPMYLDEQQKAYSENLKDINKYMIYALSGLTGMSLLFGGGELFVEILGILQFQQYLRYINLKFPLNLEIYFSFNDMLTIQPILDLLQIPQMLQFINIQEGKKYSQGKFYEENTNLLINLSSQIIQCFVFLFFIILLKSIKKVLYNSLFNQKYFQIMKYLSLSLNHKLILKVSQWLYNVCLNLIKLEQFMSFQGIQTALLLNGWDMIFKILLYTRNIQIYDQNDIIQISILIIVILFYFTIILDLFKGQQLLKYQRIRMKKFQRFEKLNFTRSLFFLLILIYFQNSQTSQLGFLILTSLFQLKILISYRKIFKKSKYIVQMVVELSVILFMLSSFLYIQEFYEFFNEEKKILLGWIHAIILSQPLAFELIIIIYDSLVKLRQKLSRKNNITNLAQIKILDDVTQN